MNGRRRVTRLDEIAHLRSEEFAYKDLELRGFPVGVIDSMRKHLCPSSLDVERFGQLEALASFAIEELHRLAAPHGSAALPRIGLFGSTHKSMYERIANLTLKSVYALNKFPDRVVPYSSKRRRWPGIIGVAGEREANDELAEQQRALRIGYEAPQFQRRNTADEGSARGRSVSPWPLCAFLEPLIEYWSASDRLRELLWPSETNEKWARDVREKLLGKPYCAMYWREWWEVLWEFVRRLYRAPDGKPHVEVPPGTLALLWGVDAVLAELEPTRQIGAKERADYNRVARRFTTWWQEPEIDALWQKDAARIRRRAIQKSDRFVNGGQTKFELRPIEHWDNGSPERTWRALVRGTIEPLLMEGAACIDYANYHHRAIPDLRNDFSPPQAQGDGFDTYADREGNKSTARGGTGALNHKFGWGPFEAGERGIRDEIREKLRNQVKLAAPKIVVRCHGCSEDFQRGSNALPTALEDCSKSGPKRRSR